MAVWVSVIADAQSMAADEHRACNIVSHLNSEQVQIEAPYIYPADRLPHNNSLGLGSVVRLRVKLWCQHKGREVALGRKHLACSSNGAEGHLGLAAAQAGGINRHHGNLVLVLLLLPGGERGAAKAKAACHEAQVL